MDPNDEQERQLIFVPSLEEGPTYRVLSDLMSFPLRGTQTDGTFLLCFDQVPPRGQVNMH